MKRLFAGIICVIMLTLCAGTGLAVQAKYANTIAFLKAMDDLDIKYVVQGVNEKKLEQIQIDNQGEQVSYTINYFFDEENTECGLRVWNLITYKDADYAWVLRAINKLNYDYKYTKWFVDETDNTITVGWDIIMRENNDVGAILSEATLHLVQIIDAGYEVLGAYDAKDASTTGN